MTRKEFQNLTGIRVEVDEYDAIEQIYYTDENLPKEAFCEWFKNATSTANGYHYLIAAGNELLTNGRDLQEARHEKEELAFFMAEQTEKCSSEELREKAIEMLGAKEYILWKLNNKHNLWKLDRELIKELIAG